MIELTIKRHLETLEYRGPDGVSLSPDVYPVWAPPGVHNEDRITFYNVTLNSSLYPCASNDVYQFDVWSKSHVSAKVMMGVLRKELRDCSLEHCHLSFEGGRALHEDNMYRYEMDVRVIYKTGE